MRLRSGLVTLSLITLAALPRLAFAHAGHSYVEGGFAEGFAHPLTGLDHLIAMLAIGLWASQVGGRAIVWLPVTFISAMLIGAGIAYSGANLPLIESGIIASLLVIGLLIAAAAKLPMFAGVIITAAFAFFHGAAHGQESGGSSPALFAFGALIATTLLHIAGVVIGSMLKARSSEILVRITGGTIATTGLLLIIGVL